jgi:hypothetical protein
MSARAAQRAQVKPLRLNPVCIAAVLTRQAKGWCDTNVGSLVLDLPIRPSSPKKFLALHKKGQVLWGSCGASLLIIHRSQGEVHLTASTPIRRAIIDEQTAGNYGICRALGRGEKRFFHLTWNPAPMVPSMPQQQQRIVKWHGAKTLVRATQQAWDARAKDEGAYLIWGMYGTTEIRSVSSEEEQLIADPWWKDVVVTQIFLQLEPMLLFLAELLRPPRWF